MNRRTLRVRVLRMPLALLEFIPNSTHDISSNPSPAKQFLFNTTDSVLFCRRSCSRALRMKGKVESDDRLVNEFIPQTSFRFIRLDYIILNFEYMIFKEEIICTNESSVLKYYCVKVYNGYEDPTTEKLSPMPIRTIFFPIWLFHTVVARGRFSLPAPAVPYNRHDTSKFTKAYTREDRRLRAGHLQVRVQANVRELGLMREGNEMKRGKKANENMHSIYGLCLNLSLHGTLV
ncbi:hypothetical protein LguiB_006329 [Lonicera macranthoides]